MIVVLSSVFRRGSYYLGNIYKENGLKYKSNSCKIYTEKIFKMRIEI